MRINDIIHMMYDNKYNYEEPIIAECSLTSENVIANGKIEIKRNSEVLRFIAESWKCNNATEVSGMGNLQTVKISSETLPLNFKCEITNLPLDNRIDDFVEKNIVIKLHKVSAVGDFTINLEENKSSFECDLLPLYDINSCEIGRIYVI